MGVVGSFLNGVVQSALYVGLGLYGASLGLDTGRTATLIAALTIGGMLLQFPVGRLSDAVDRRWVIVGCSVAALPICASLILRQDGAADFTVTCLLVAGIGGMCLPIYSICLAHANDYLTREEIVPAGSSLIMVFYVGLVIGPTLSAAIIDRLGSAGLFYFVGAVQVLTALTGSFRLLKGRERAEEPGTALAYGAANTTAASFLDPGVDESRRTR